MIMLIVGFVVLGTVALLDDELRPSVVKFVQKGMVTLDNYRFIKPGMTLHKVHDLGKNSCYDVGVVKRGPYEYESKSSCRVLEGSLWIDVIRKTSAMFGGVEDGNEFSLSCQKTSLADAGITEKPYNGHRMFFDAESAKAYESSIKNRGGMSLVSKNSDDDFQIF